MRVAVVGAAGVVGTAVIEGLRNDPDKRVDAVIGLSRRPPVVPQPHVDWRQLDLDHDDIAPHLTGVDVVINLTRPRGRLHRNSGPEDFRAVTTRVLQSVADAGVVHVVQASTFLVYSPAHPLHDPVTEEWPIDGVADAPFVHARVAAERAVEEFAAAHEIIRVVRLRAGLVLGPGAFAQLAVRLGRMADVLRAAGHLPVLPVIDGATVPVVHHDDLAAAYRLAATGSGRGPYNVALDTRLDLRTVARALGARPVPVPAGAADRVLGGRSTGNWLAIASRAPSLDSSLARAELGWQPVHPLDDAIRSTVRAR